MTVLKGENISKNFNLNGLSKMSFELNEGDFLCIVGESGCGKTTFLNIVSGMLHPDTGSVFLGDKNMFTEMREKERTAMRNTTVGYMMQGNALIPELSVWQNIICPAELSGKRIKDDDVYSVTDRLGISNILDSFPSEISGGEYRRVLLARILLLDTPILLVDEPTSNLDEKSALIVRQVLKEANDKGKSIIVVTHDKEFLTYSTKVINLKQEDSNDKKD